MSPPSVLYAAGRAAPHPHARHQVILVREQDAQHSGSGCCGRLGGEDSVLGKAADFSHSRRRMEAIGEIYRELAERAPELDLVVADPRNLVWLYPAVWRAARSRGFGVFATLRSMARAGSPVAVVLDGETLFQGRLPDTRQVVNTILWQLSNRLDA